MWQKKLFILVFLFGTLQLSSPVWADPLDDLQKKINDLQAQLGAAQSQEKTLSAEVTRLNNQISLTNLQIESTQAKIDSLTDKIASLSGRINSLESSLKKNSEVLAHRIEKTYIEGRADPLLFLISSADFNDFISRFEQLRIAQKQDKKLMEQMALSRKNYNDQKVDLEGIKRQKEQLFVQLTALKVDLDRQNQAKQALLSVTRNNEARYQQLIADARRELEAIRTSQFTGKRDVKKGEVIGLMGSTGFSTGPHLHFGVYNLSEGDAAQFNYNDRTNNPLDYLRSRGLIVDSGACYDKSGNTNVGNGSWDWPMSNPRISQCFGKTPYSFVYANGLHEGLDMYDNNDLLVRSIDDGVAYFYRGSSSFGNNVRIFHSSGKMTLYLHLQ